MERSCSCPCPAASFSFRKRLSIYLEKLSIMWSTSLTKKTDMWCRLTNENHPGDFWWNYERSSLSSGISSNKKDIAGEYYHQMGKIKATSENTELRGGRNIFLMTSFEPLDPVISKAHSMLTPFFFYRLLWSSRLNCSSPRLIYLGLLHCRQILYCLSHQGHPCPAHRE